MWVWVGVAALLSFTTCIACQSAVLAGGTLQFTTPQYGTGRADVARVWSTGWQDLHEQRWGDIQIQNTEYGNFSCFLLLPLLFLGYNATRLVPSIPNRCAREEKSATYFS